MATSITLSPILAALLAVVGATLGESTGYMFGGGSQEVVRKGKLYQYIDYLGERSKRGIVACSAAIPIYLSGVWTGVFGMSYKRSLVLSIIGTVVLFGLIGLIAQLGG